MWTKEKIQSKKDYFRAQRSIKTGKFTEFTVRVYYCIYKACVSNNSRSCLANESNAYKINKIVYEGFYGGKPDHGSQGIIDDCKKYLKEMGYIKYKKENDKWYINIISPLDFLLEGEHEFYMSKYGIDTELF